jgi:hypothetical protein
MSKGGGLLQLVATGRQDIYLTGNPQTTFFKQVYRRHTNFSIESQRIPFETGVEFNKLITTTIPRNGDLLTQLMLEISLPQITPNGPIIPSSSCDVPVDVSGTVFTSWVNGIGYAMIDYVSIQFGSQEIDRLYGEWLYIWSKLSTPGAKQAGFNYMIGYQEAYDDNTQTGPLKLFVPLNFWFCKNVGLALPLIALQSMPIRILIKLKNGNDMVYSRELVTNPSFKTATPPTILDMVLWGDFVFLDVEERRRFTSSRHEYLIEQTQIQRKYPIPASALYANVPLNFNHPLKEIVWVVQENRMTNYHEPFNFTPRALTEYGISTDLISTALLQFDGYDRFEKRSAPYFRLVQPWQRHTSIPNDFIYIYSFSLAPESEQPQGTCNASRIDSINLQVEMNTAITRNDCGITVYATNYNILRIVAGLGGLLFTV